MARSLRLRGVPTVQTETVVPPVAIHVPHLHIHRSVPSVWMMQPGHAEVVARRVREALRASA